MVNAGGIGGSELVAVGVPLARIMRCAVQRHGLPVGANPTRQLSLQPVAIGAAAQDGRLKPSV